jgi:hypothetical protein
MCTGIRDHAQHSALIEYVNGIPVREKYVRGE